MIFIKIKRRCFSSYNNFIRKIGSLSMCQSAIINYNLLYVSKRALVRGYDKLVRVQNETVFLFVALIKSLGLIIIRKG